jgi:hypothetical protein
MRKILLSRCSRLPWRAAQQPRLTATYLQSATVDQQKLASEAVKQLATLYPPAKTRFELQQATPDAFGAGLVKELRESGYALLEFNPEAAKAKASASAAAPAVEAPASATKALPLRYVLDQAGTSNLYRLTLLVGNQSITRPYLEQDGTLRRPGIGCARSKP